MRILHWLAAGTSAIAMAAAFTAFPATAGNPSFHYVGPNGSTTCVDIGSLKDRFFRSWESARLIKFLNDDIEQGGRLYVGYAHPSREDLVSEKSWQTRNMHVGGPSLTANDTAATDAHGPPYYRVDVYRVGSDSCAMLGKGLSYVALGDSYSSGLGTQSGLTHNGTCERTSSAWPNLLAEQMGLTLKANLSCSGAKSFNLTSWFKGQFQLNRLKALEPDVVTVMIGGNDVGFSDVLQDCFRHHCNDDGKLSQSEGNIHALTNQLIPIFMKIRRAVPSAKIVVVGYPNIFPGLGQPIVRCGWMSDEEQQDLDQLAVKLDYAEMVAVEATNDSLGPDARLQYVSALSAFHGHQLCSNNSWVFALRATCALDNRCGHPLLAGQQAIAETVRRAIRLP